MKHLQFGRHALRRSASGGREDSAMTGSILGTRPRPPAAAECMLVEEWLASTGDIASAYVSRRRNDDPALFWRIVVTINPDEGPAHIIHAPAGRDFWIVLTLRPVPTQRKHRTLFSALNSIRRVLPRSRQQHLLTGIFPPLEPARAVSAQ